MRGRLHRRICCAAVLTSCLLGCGTRSTTPFQDIARPLDVAISNLRPAASVVLAPQSNDAAGTKKVDEACLGVRDQLWDLRTVRFDDDAVPDGFLRAPLDYASQRVLLLYWPSWCGHWDESAASASGCRRDCIEAWTHLQKEVEEVRAAAEREGVFIIPLRP